MAEKVVLSADALNLAVGSTAKLTRTVTTTWASADPSVATVNQKGLVTAIAPGVTSIICSIGDVSDSCAITVPGVVQDPAPSPTPDPVPSGSTNEPSGMNLISSRPFNALYTEGWDEPTNEQPESNVTILTDSTCPHSPDKALRFIYKAGSSGGGAPWDADSPPFAYKTVYVSHWARVSANWQGHPGSSINKMYYLYTTTDVPSIVVVLWGANDEPLRPFIEGQNIQSGGQGSADPQNPDWGPNLVPDAHVVRGEWFNIELVAQMNSASMADGYLDLWLNGVHITHVPNIKFQGSSPSWRSLHHAPVWGGGGGTVAQTQYMDFDHLYVSGK